MKCLAGGLVFVNAATILGLSLGMIFGGLGRSLAAFSILFAFLVAVVAYWQTSTAPREIVAGPNESTSGDPASAQSLLRHAGFWLLAGCFGFFAFRSFCWLLFSDGNQLKVQSINNLGDLSLHLTYIRNFASGVALWPDNPIYVFSKLRYPAGVDLFNALLLLLGLDVTHGLIWTGLIGTLATFYALYRWGGLFGLAGFLFNGGLVGFVVLLTGKFLDYQGAKNIAWKSLPLSMLVTQRGLLYALPAGLLLLCHWRAKYLAASPNESKIEGAFVPKPIFPFWIELALYATMPLFHVHTFIALSIVAAFLFLLGNATAQKQLGSLVATAFVPATFFIWLITDHFQARSLMKLHLSWVQDDGDFAAPFFHFWLENFGIFLPLVIALVGFCLWRIYQSSTPRTFTVRLAFLAPAVFIFLFACIVQTAPWEWDNIKLILWAYLLVLPILWRELIAHWPVALRVVTCLALFFSGFVSLFGGLTSNRDGYAIGDRSEIDAVGQIVHRLPAEARFAAFPTYNHPLLLQGRKLVLGYPGHLWTQGFDYSATMARLERLMRGAPDWREQARDLHARYLFFGREEKLNYPSSTRPWEKEARLLASGPWGALYDLEAPPR